jgi:hypothetical protein
VVAQQSVEVWVSGRGSVCGARGSVYSTPQDAAALVATVSNQSLKPWQAQVVAVIPCQAQAAALRVCDTSPQPATGLH